MPENFYPIKTHLSDNNDPIFAIVRDRNDNELFTFDEHVLDGERMLTIRFTGKLRSLNSYSGHNALTFHINTNEEV